MSVDHQLAEIGEGWLKEFNIEANEPNPNQQLLKELKYTLNALLPYGSFGRIHEPSVKDLLTFGEPIKMTSEGAIRGIIRHAHRKYEAARKQLLKAPNEEAIKQYTQSIEELKEVEQQEREKEQAACDLAKIRLRSILPLFKVKEHKGETGIYWTLYPKQSGGKMTRKQTRRNKV